MFGWMLTLGWAERRAPTSVVDGWLTFNLQAFKLCGRVESCGLHDASETHLSLFWLAAQLCTHFESYGSTAY
eukprot:COSAG02_NODE_43833_length_371_cov_0.882353_1_plen_72_part_00